MLESPDHHGQPRHQHGHGQQSARQPRLDQLRVAVAGGGAFGAGSQAQVAHQSRHVQDDLHDRAERRVDHGTEGEACLGGKAGMGRRDDAFSVREYFICLLWFKQYFIISKHNYPEVYLTILRAFVRKKKVCFEYVNTKVDLFLIPK
jgi:hypothetical protein